jgi:uncharacterized repeat protein (TIGR02543 family)
MKQIIKRKCFAWIGLVATLSGMLALAESNVQPAQAAAAVDCSSTMTAQNSMTVTPSHGSVFYIDSSVTPKVDSAYVAYKIDNTSGTAKTNVWLQLSSFTGGKVSLANPADAAQQITVPANGTATAFFLLKATGSTTVAQAHVVQIFDQRPDLVGATSQLACNFSFKKVAETIKASANKIDTVTGALSPAAATLGGTYTITVKGQTGKIGSGSTPDGKVIWASPSAYSSWPTRSLRLVSTQIKICTGNNYTSTPVATIDNQLLYNPGTFPGCLGNNGDTWIGIYTFRIIGPGPSSLAPSPVAIISSGTQYKHSDVNGITTNTSVNLSGVANSDIAVNVTASSSVVASTASSVTIRYTASISTTSTTALTVDELVDAHGAGTTYVSGSAKAGTNVASLSSISDPSVLAADSNLSPPPYHFVGPYTTVSGTPYYIQYDFVIPCAASTTTYSTNVYAYTGDVQIGSSSTTISTSNVTTSTSAGCSNPTVQTVATSMTPNAVTNPATSVAATTATLNGFANPVGQTGVQYQFAYATDPNLVNGVSYTTLTSAIGSSSVTASANITGLSPSTLYYFRAVVVDSSGTRYNGLTLSFVTAAQQATPTVTTGAVSGVSGGSATLNGTTNPNLTAITGVFFRLCTDQALSTGCISNTFVVVDDGTGTATNLTFTAAASGDFDVNTDSILGAQRVTGLSAGTTYYYRLSVTCTANATYCAGGQVDGAVRSFTYGAPIATTSSATQVGATSATLNGVVNANSTTANTSLCYSTTNNVTNGVLGSVTCVTSTPSSATGSSDTSISAGITGLTGGTTYYFQAKAVVTSPSYFSYGSVLSFVTLAQTGSTTLTAGQVGTSYTASLTGIGGSGSYTWSASSTLPAGLTLSPTGLISGTPTVGGTYTIVVRMLDPTSDLYVDVSYTLEIQTSVTFHSNYTGGASDITQSASTTTALRSNTFSRTGYTFGGWASTPSGSLAYADGANYDFTSSTDLYAIWQIDSHLITYAKNDGGASTTSQSYDYGATTALSYANPFTRTGYTFLGWSTSPTATTADSSHVVTGVETLYAVWEAQSYVITYESNDGNSASTPETYSYGSTDALSYVNPWTYSGYSFLGWSTDPSATQADSSYTVTGSDTLYAIWELNAPNSVTITYSKNDGQGATQQDSFQIGDTTALDHTNVWTRTGYTFLGWSSSPTASAPDSSYTVSTDATLYAVWELNTYVITYDKNDGGSTTVTDSLSHGSTSALAYVNPWTRTGYTFLGWSTNPNATQPDSSYTVTGAAVLYAVWELESYVITYEKNDGGSSSVTETYSYGDSDALLYSNPWTRPGYAFIGWSTDPSATAADNSYTVEGPASLYAIWVEDPVATYTITYLKNDGSGESVEGEYNDGDTSALIYENPFDRPGYTFLGWSTSPGATLPATSYTVSGNDSLYAVWQINTYLITFNSNDGTSRTFELTVEYGDGSALAEANPWLRAGYEFVGWSTDYKASEPDVSFFASADGYLYAIWSIKSYDVTYLSNDGQLLFVIEVKEYGSTDALDYLNPWSRTGYNFLGWSTSPTATTGLLTITITEDVELYGVWQVISYTITYNKNTGATVNVNYNYGVTNALNYTTSWTVDGYSFVGWAVDSAATSQDLTFTVVGDETLFAVWRIADPASLSNFPDRTRSISAKKYIIIAPTTNSPGAITYSASCAGVATVAGTTATFLNPGLCVITATVSAAPNYSSATISMTLTITPAVVYVPPVVPPTTTNPTVTGSNGTLTLVYQKPAGKVILDSKDPGDPNENWTLKLQGTDPNGTPTPLNTLKQLEFETGNKVVTEGTGFKPSTTVVVFIDTLKLGTLTTKLNGTFRAAFFIPASLAPGVEIIQVNGITKNNVLRSVSLPIVIGAAGKFTLKRSVYFLGDSAKVTGKGGEVLLSILAVLRGKKNIVVTVSGWVKETSDKSYDARLSKERAQNMVYVLQDIYGIKGKYSYKGYGISPENTEKSRRADIVITYTN